MRSAFFVFKAVVGSNCIIEPGTKVIGVQIADNRYVPMGAILNKQSDADHLPKITVDYIFRTLNQDVVRVNVQLAGGYNKKLPKKI